ncbi:hypothetical protein GCM10017688_02300 [Streptomyces ramulosus]
MKPTADVKAKASVKLTTVVKAKAAVKLTVVGEVKAAAKVVAAVKVTVATKAHAVAKPPSTWGSVGPGRGGRRRTRPGSGGSVRIPCRCCSMRQGCGRGPSCWTPAAVRAR